VIHQGKAQKMKYCCWKKVMISCLIWEMVWFMGRQMKEGYSFMYLWRQKNTFCTNIMINCVIYIGRVTMLNAIRKMYWFKNSMEKVMKCIENCLKYIAFAKDFYIVYLHREEKPRTLCLNWEHSFLKIV